MDESNTLSSISTDEQHKSIEESFAKYKQLIASTYPRCDLPLQPTLFQHKDHMWFSTYELMVSTLVAQDHLVSRPTDVFVTSFPKSGTTWLKGLVSSISTRNDMDKVNSLAPHHQIPFLEFHVYPSDDQIMDIDSLQSPRFLSTHIPYPSLPKSMIDSGCRIVYIWRDPKATFVSFFHFSNQIRTKYGTALSSIEDRLKWFCDGYCWFGPYWDHVLGYWNAKKNGGNILFLKYEDMMEDPCSHIKTLAEFMGVPFTEQEEKEGVMQAIIASCSFDKMKDSDVNKIGKTMLHVEVDNNSFFREGKTNDWVNYLTPEMVEKLDRITKERFADTDLIP
ncbi:Aryl sulfotransferase [Zostera marina]|uniref:Sulfotransferase n=1 Tax=Zostera marina TaxID=29655 RepID=A0A0K9PYK8_ZOSMR|nr:Aryl sulfotransferase [Zostera marina]